MKRNQFFSKNDIEKFADGIYKQYLAATKNSDEKIDIDFLVQNVFGINVYYETFAEDQDALGFTGDGETPLHIIDNQCKKPVVIKHEDIIIERYLLNDFEENKRRFVLAHEFGHVMINRIFNHNQVAFFHDANSNTNGLTPAQINKRFHVIESQANSIGAAILLPRKLVEKIMKKNFEGGKLIRYDGVILPLDKTKVWDISHRLGVSFSTLVIRLKTLNLIDDRSMDDYVLSLMEAN